MRVSKLALGLGLGLLLASSSVSNTASAEAGFLGKGDVSLGLMTVYEPFNTYWYYQGPETPLPYDLYRNPSQHNRLGLGNYGLEDLGVRADLFSLGLRAEVGITDNFSIFGETAFVRGALVDTSFEPTASIGDSRLGVKIALTQDSPVVASVISSIKIPGLYQIQTPYSPGDGQADWDIKLAVGGLTMHRRMFYDVGLGYRVRFPFASPQVFRYSVTDADTDVPCLPEGTNCEGYDVYFPLDGPANETFMDLTLGYFINRRSLVFFNMNGVDSHYGISWDDYSAASSVTGQDATTGEPQAWKLFPEFEEDYLRVGIGFLTKPAPSVTAYVNYSYTVLGRNTAGVLRTDAGIPVGAIAVGFEFTFGTKASPGRSARASTSLDTQQVLARDFSPTSVL